MAASPSLLSLEDAVRKALDEARAALRTLYGDELLHLVLYGSQARGDARSGSDVDLLVVLRGAFDVYRETIRLVDIETALFDRYGLNVHLLPVTSARYADRLHPLMRNVHAAGVEL